MKGGTTAGVLRVVATLRKVALSMDSIELQTNINRKKSDNRTYSTQDIAAILGVSLRKAQYLCTNSPDFIVKRIGAHCIRIHKESFDRWFNEAENSGCAL